MTVHQINEFVIQNALKEISPSSVPSNFSIQSHQINQTHEISNNFTDKLKSILSNKNCVIVGILILIVLGILIFKKDKKLPRQNIIYF